MRILLVTHYFSGHGGGIEIAAQRLAEQFAGRGHRVTWWASAVGSVPAPVEHIEYRAVRAWNGIEHAVHVPFPVWSPACVRSLWREVGSADVVNVHEFIYPGSLMSVLVACLRRKPVVLTQHTGAVTFSSRVLTVAYAAVAGVLGRVVMSAARQVVFVSDNVRRHFVGSRRRGRRTQLIYNGLEPGWSPARSADERSRARQALGLGDAQHVVLFVGRFIAKKGLDVIRQLVPRFGDATWILAGAGPVQPEGWGYGNVSELGQLGHNGLARAYQVADLLILPSLSEGFPLVVQEALACGTAVLSTDEVATACPEASDIIRAAPVPKRPECIDAWEIELRAALGDARFIADRESRAAKARALWSWPACADAYLQVFDNAVSGATKS